MRDKILKLVTERPKHYAILIKNDAEMMNWVEKNSKTSSDNIAAKVYSAIHDESDVCENGNTKKFTRFSTGFSGCGPASVCECTRRAISCSVSNTKQKLDEDAKQNINEKRNATMIEKYGVAFNSQRDEIKQIWTGSKLESEAEEKLSNFSWIETEYIANQRSATDIAHELGVHYSTVIEYCKKHGFSIRRRANYSMTEREISEYIESLGIKTENGNWDILETLELDIVIPSKSIAIEVNGLYWHSSSGIDNDNNFKSKHLNKTCGAFDKNIDLIHITDWEWNNKNQIVKSIIRSKLGLNNKIHARKCAIVNMGTSSARTFFDANHIQGFCSASFYIGLEFNGQIVEAIAVGKNRFSKNKQVDSFELIRLASTSGITVVGGLSKLLSSFRKSYPQCEIISYCDRSKSNGNGYKSVGFVMIGETDPGYFWTDGTEVISRHRAQKSKIHKIVPDADISQSESEIMFGAGYRRYWDCGNMVFKLA